MTKKELGYTTDIIMCETCNNFSTQSIYVKEVDRFVYVNMCLKVTKGSNRVSELGTCNYHSEKTGGNNENSLHR